MDQTQAIRTILDRCRTMAVVGLSPKPHRDSFQVAQQGLFMRISQVRTGCKQRQSRRTTKPRQAVWVRSATTSGAVCTPFPSGCGQKGHAGRCANLPGATPAASTRLPHDLFVPQRISRNAHEQALMQAQGWRIVPINPNASGEILGEKVYPSLSEAAKHERIELVNCFRNSADIQPIVDEAIAIGAQAVWMQLGVEHAAAAEKARAAGLVVVQNRCLKIDHAARPRV